jgi:hypothetical protein
MRRCILEMITCLMFLPLPTLHRWTYLKIYSPISLGGKYVTLVMCGIHERFLSATKSHLFIRILYHEVIARSPVVYFKVVSKTSQTSSRSKSTTQLLPGDPRRLGFPNPKSNKLAWWTRVRMMFSLVGSKTETSYCFLIKEFGLEWVEWEIQFLVVSTMEWKMEYKDMIWYDMIWMVGITLSSWKEY